MKKIKLIASDMDQTFLRNDGTFDQEYFSKILNRLDQHQIKFVAASGRSLWLIEDIFGKKLGKRIDYVAENGGFVMADGQKIAGEGISADVLRQAESFCAKHFSKNYLIAAGKDYAYTLDADAFQKIGGPHQKTFSHNVKQVADFADLEADIYKLTIFTPDNNTEEVAEIFNQGFKQPLTAVVSGYGAVDLIKPGLHKAWGLKQLMNYLELDASNLMAFGDDLNDIEMLKLADYAYAMENAKPKVKDAASFIAPNNNESGVLQVIEKYLDELD